MRLILSVLSFLILFLAACASSTEPDQIEIYSGGFGGMNKTIIYADDRAYFESFRAGDPDPSRRWKELPAGSYLKAREIVETMMPNIQDVLPGDESATPCPTDVGVTVLSVQPSIAGRRSIRIECRASLPPDMRRLIDAIYAVIPR